MLIIKLLRLDCKKKNPISKKNPNSNLYQIHEAYERGYNQQINSYAFSRKLRQWDIIGSGTVEGCNPGNPELQRLRNELQKIAVKKPKP